MITALLVIVAVVLGLLAGIAITVPVSQVRGRDAADPDKETPAGGSPCDPPQVSIKERMPCGYIITEPSGRHHIVGVQEWRNYCNFREKDMSISESLLAAGITK